MMYFAKLKKEVVQFGRGNESVIFPLNYASAVSPKILFWNTRWAISHSQAKWTHRFDSLVDLVVFLKKESSIVDRFYQQNVNVTDEEFVSEIIRISV